MLPTESIYSVLTTPVVMLLLAGCVFMCWRAYRRIRALLWLGIAFSLTSLAYVGQVVLPSHWPVSLWAPTLACLHFGGTFFLTQAVCTRLGVRLPRLQVVLLFAGTLGAMVYFSLAQDHMPTRTVVMGIGLGLCTLLPMPALLRQQRPHWLEKCLLASHGGFAIFLLARPLLMLEQMGYRTPDREAQGLFWWFTSLGVMLFGIVFTGTLLACLVHDMLRQLRAERSHDALTGVLNRLAFREATRQIPQAPCTLVMCDLDHFKQVNDLYGHPMGDAVLQRFALLLREGVREGDLVARLGGEEFALLLRGVNEREGAAIVARMLERLHAQSFTHAHQSFQVTASFGLAQWDSSMPLQACLALADQSLYQAKHRGRDQLCCYAEGAFISVATDKPAPPALAPAARTPAAVSEPTTPRAVAEAQKAEKAETVN